MDFQQAAEAYLHGAERAVNERDWDGYGALFAEDVQMRVPGAIDGLAGGRRARVDFVKGILHTFPDGRIHGVRVFGAEPWACCQFRFEGTNTGPLAGPGGDAEPTGRPVAFPYCVVARLEDGIIVEFDEYFDQLEMLRQLGVA